MSRVVSPVPTPDEVRALLCFDGKVFTFRPRPVEAFKTYGAWKIFANNFANRPVAIKHFTNGYKGIRLRGRLLMVHRLVWLFHYGEWPAGDLDHINGDAADNRIENLRDVSRSQNMRNQKLRVDSTSGFPGVHWDKSRQKWSARIGVNGTWQNLGRYEIKGDAIRARKAAEARLGFSPIHGRATRVLNPRAVELAA